MSDEAPEEQESSQADDDAPASDGGHGGNWALGGGIVGAAIFFLFFKTDAPSGALSDFGKPTLFLICGALLFTLIHKIIDSLG